MPMRGTVCAISLIAKFNDKEKSNCVDNFDKEIDNCCNEFLYRQL